MSDIVERLRSTEFASATDGLRSPVIWVKGTVAREAADEIEKLRAALKTARRDALKEALLVIANKSALETPASFEDILQRDIEMMNAIRALGEKE